MERLTGKELENYLIKADEKISSLFYDARDLILKLDPDIDEKLKWSNACYLKNKDIFYLFPQKNYLTFGFFQATSLEDPSGLLEGTGKNMRHVKIYEPDDLKKKELIRLCKSALTFEINLIKKK